MEKADEAMTEGERKVELPSAAVSSRDTTALRLLIEKGGVDTTIEVDGLVVPLIHSCSLLDWCGGIDYVLAAGADPMQLAEEGRTALHYGKSAAVVDALVSAGAVVDSRDGRRATPLWSASSAGYDGAVSALLRHGADVNAASKDGQTPLYAACSKGHVNVVSVLLESKPDLNAVTTSGRTPLWVASISGAVEAARLLLESGADPILAGADNITPLHAACNSGHKAIIDMLLPLDVPINLKLIPDGRSPLWMAACGGFSDAVAALIAAGADVEAPLPDGRTALYMAASAGHTSVVHVLLEAGASPAAYGDSGATSLHAASHLGFFDIVTALLKYGADANAGAKNGETPLWVACNSGKLDVIEALIEAGAKVDVLIRGRSTPLWMAASSGHVDAVLALLAAGAEVDLTSMDGRTPLWIACCQGYDEIVDTLLELGADVNVRSDGAPAASRKGGVRYVEVTKPIGESALYIAAQNGHTNVVKMLIAAGADVDLGLDVLATPLWIAACSGYEEIVKALLAAGANCTARLEEGGTPLCFAAERGHHSIVLALIDSGADVNTPMDDGRTALWIASCNGHVAVAAVLLKNGARVDLADKSGATPLSAASQRGHVAIMAMLIARGADVNTKDEAGITALVAASSVGKVDAVTRLLSSGADVNLSADGGITPLIGAAHNGHTSVISALLSAGAYVNAVGMQATTALFQAAKNGHEGIVALLLAAGADVTVESWDGETPLQAAAAGGHAEIMNALLAAGADVNTFKKDDSKTRMMRRLLASQTATKAAPPLDLLRAFTPLPCAKAADDLQVIEAQNAVADSVIATSTALHDSIYNSSRARKRAMAEAADGSAADLLAQLAKEEEALRAEPTAAPAKEAAERLRAAVARCGELERVILDLRVSVVEAVGREVASQCTGVVTDLTQLKAEESRITKRVKAARKKKKRLALRKALKALRERMQAAAADAGAAEQLLDVLSAEGVAERLLASASQLIASEAAEDCGVQKKLLAMLSNVLRTKKRLKTEITHAACIATPLADGKVKAATAFAAARRMYDKVTALEDAAALCRRAMQLVEAEEAEASDAAVDEAAMAAAVEQLHDAKRALQLVRTDRDGLHEFAAEAAEGMLADLARTADSAKEKVEEAWQQVKRCAGSKRLAQQQLAAEIVEASKGKEDVFLALQLLAKKWGSA